jgi:hypothetical protein
MKREKADVRGFIGLLIAESDLDEEDRRPSESVDDRLFWPDVSGGLGQQTVKYAVDYGLGDGSPSRANIDAVMDVLQTDVARALDIAAYQYGKFFRTTGSWQEAVAKYNGGPNASWRTIPLANRNNYTRGWTRAAPYVVEEEEVQPVGDHVFEAGFADLALALGDDVVGAPVEDEQHPDPDHSYQATTKGLMWWSNGGAPLFLKAVLA